MSQEEISDEPQLIHRQVIGRCGELLGIKYEVEFSVVYLAGGSFYLEYPTEVLITDMGGLELGPSELEAMKESLLSQAHEELRRAPYYTVHFFGLTYIPNPKHDPDFDPNINPFEKWGD